MRTLLSIASLRAPSPNRCFLKTLCVLWAILLVCITPLIGADSTMSFVASTDKTSVSVGETLVYRMTLRGAQVQSIPAFTVPDFGKHFQIVGSEESVTYQILNGNLNAVKTRSLRLRALAEGSYEIPSGELRIGKEVLKSQPIRVQIGASKAPAGLPPGQETNSNAPVLLDIQLSNRTPYVGEPVSVEVLLHRRASFFGNPQFEPLQIAGALTEALQVQDQTRESIRNGQRFYTNTLQKLIITPLSHGKLGIPASRLGFQTGPFDRLQVIQSPVTDIHVRQLPSLPEGLTYSGVVGEFEWRIKVDESSIQQLSPLVISFSIYGKGNLKPLTDFQVTESQEMRIYRSKSQDRSKARDDGSLQAEKQLEYIVVPQLSGALTLPTFSWTYFSPQKGRYITLSSPKIDIQVRPASGNVETASGLSIQQDKLNREIRYLKPLTPPTLWHKKSIQQPLWVLSLSLFFSGTALWLWRRIMKQNPLLERKQKAYSVASKALRELKDHPNEKSLSRAQTILLEFLGDRLGVSFLGLTHPEIKSLLLKENVDELLIVNTLDVLEKLAFALYAPSRVDSHSKAALISEAEVLLTQLKALP